MTFASAVAQDRDLAAAAAAAVDAVRGGFRGEAPGLVLAFAAGYDSRRLADLHDALQPWLGDGLLVGCNAAGVIGDGHEIEEEPALALLAMRAAGTEFTAVRLEQRTLPAVNAAREAWWKLAGVPASAAPSFMLLADPFTFDAEHCVRGLDRSYADATVVGGLNSAASQPGHAGLFVNDEVHDSGAVLLAVTGALRLEGLVAQGCRPIGEPLFVTAAAQNRIRELDGQPPRQVLGHLLASLGPRDRELFNDRQLFIGLALPGPRQVVGTGDFLVRTVVGLDAQSGELVIGGQAGENSVVQFQLRDAEASAADLERQLQRHKKRDPAAPLAALMFSCVGRGAGLYGVPHRDSGLFRRAFGDVPVGGMFCAGEIGPVQGTTFLHGYTTVLGLLRRRAG